MTIYQIIFQGHAGFISEERMKWLEFTDWPSGKKMHPFNIVAKWTIRLK